MTSVFFEWFESNDNIHQEYLDVLEFDIPTDDASIFTKALPYSINQGSQDKMGQQKPVKSRIYVDDSLSS